MFLFYISLVKKIKVTLLTYLLPLILPFLSIKSLNRLRVPVSCLCVTVYLLLLIIPNDLYIPLAVVVVVVVYKHNFSKWERVLSLSVRGTPRRTLRAPGAAA